MLHTARKPSFGTDTAASLALAVNQTSPNAAMPQSTPNSAMP